MLETEPIGSIPASGIAHGGPRHAGSGTITAEAADQVAQEALVDTIARFEATGSPVITDGEQTKSSFVTYPHNGLGGIGAGGATIPFADGHERQLPQLTAGPFRYGRHADAFYLQAPTAHRGPSSRR